MSRFRLPTQKGTELFPATTRLPVMVRFQGVPPGSPLARALYEQLRGKIDRFYDRQAQNYSLSVVEVSAKLAKIDGVTMRYTALQGVERIDVTVPVELIEKVIKELEPEPERKGDYLPWVVVDVRVRLTIYQYWDFIFFVGGDPWKTDAWRPSYLWAHALALDPAEFTPETVAFSCTSAPEGAPHPGFDTAKVRSVEFSGDWTRGSLYGGRFEGEDIFMAPETMEPQPCWVTTSFLYKPETLGARQSLHLYSGSCNSIRSGTPEDPFVEFEQPMVAEVRVREFADNRVPLSRVSAELYVENGRQAHDYPIGDDTRDWDPPSSPSHLTNFVAAQDFERRSSEAPGDMENLGMGQELATHQITMEVAPGEDTDRDYNQAYWRSSTPSNMASVVTIQYSAPATTGGAGNAEIHS